MMVLVWCDRRTCGQWMLRLVQSWGYQKVR